MEINRSRKLVTSYGSEETVFFFKVLYICPSPNSITDINNFVDRPEGKKPLGGPKHRWKDNIKEIIKKWNMRVWTRFIWLRIGIIGRLL
jgi:hypothetical protein